MPARQLLRELYDVANFPSNFPANVLGLKNRRGPEDYKPHLAKSATNSAIKSARESAASLARSRAVISVGFRAWDVVCGVTQVRAWIAWLVRAFLKAVLLDGWKPTGADSQGQPDPMLCVTVCMLHREGPQDYCLQPTRRILSEIIKESA